MLPTQGGAAAALIGPSMLSELLIVTAGSLSVPAGAGLAIGALQVSFWMLIIPSPLCSHIYMTDQLVAFPLAEK